MWEHLAQYPDRAQVFNNGVVAQVHAVKSPMKSIACSADSLADILEHCHLSLRQGAFQGSD